MPKDLAANEPKTAPVASAALSEAAAPDVAIPTLEGPRIVSAEDAPRERRIQAFMDEFASNDTERRAYRRAIDEGVSSAEFVNQFAGKADTQTLRKYLQVNYEKAVG